MARWTESREEREHFARIYHDLMVLDGSNQTLRVLLKGGKKSYTGSVIKAWTDNSLGQRERPWQWRGAITIYTAEGPKEIDCLTIDSLQLAEE